MSDKVFQIDFPLPESYPNTPLGRALREQYKGMAGYLMGVVREGNDPWMLRLARGYKTKLPRKKFYVHIAAFYMYPMRWNIQRLAMPGELEAFKGKGRWMLCRMLNSILKEYKLPPNEIGVSLEASGGECRFDAVPKYPDQSIESITSYITTNFPKSIKEIPMMISDEMEASKGTMDRKTAYNKLYCIATDEMKLVQYYKSYGLVPVMARAGVNQVFMYGSADTVMEQCAIDVSTFPLINFGPPFSESAGARPTKRARH